jgi:hypothetical protein
MTIRVCGMIQLVCSMGMWIVVKNTRDSTDLTVAFILSVAALATMKVGELIDNRRH